MKFSASHNFAFETPDFEAAADFYERVFGFERRDTDAQSLHLVSVDQHFYFDKAKEPSLIFEFVVEDLDAAKSHLLQNGCTLLEWGGLGKPNYVRDPFGFTFNVWQDPRSVIE
jgi:predicted enzyme related to lactoylglutathione lyase